jgi:hypothetical protein
MPVPRIIHRFIARVLINLEGLKHRAPNTGNRASLVQMHSDRFGANAMSPSGRIGCDTKTSQSGQKRRFGVAFQINDLSSILSFSRVGLLPAAATENWPLAKIAQARIRQSGRM